MNIHNLSGVNPTYRESRGVPAFYILEGGEKVYPGVLRGCANSFTWDQHVSAKLANRINRRETRQGV